MPELPKAGDTLDGKYALLRVLGQGGMGIVFEAEHLRLKQKCAIKMLSPHMLAMRDIVERFEREARASAKLKSPHVARVVDVATTNEDVPYIVMELLVGRDLDGELQDRGRIPHEQAVDYVLQACGAIAEAHAAGIIHRDLKPGNLFLAHHEEEVVVKVLDFGISKVTGDEGGSKLTGANTLMGTALYMPPEQLRAAATVDARSDIWALGVILYELLSGETPWTGTAPQVAAAIVTEDPPDITAKCSLPVPLVAVMLKMLRRDPAQRFQSISELAAALTPFAPEASVGRAVADQLVRRSRRSIADLPPSDPQMRATDVEAPTVAREVTNVGVTTNAGLPKTSGSRILLLVAAAIAFAAAIAGVGVLALRGNKEKETSVAPPSAETNVPPPPAASPSVVAAPQPPASILEPPKSPLPTATTHATAGAKPKASASAATRPKPPASAVVNPQFLP